MSNRIHLLRRRVGTGGRSLVFGLVAVAVNLVGSRAIRAQNETAPPANRLARETSPYLLLHAHNPVDWYPWGPDAFAKAKAENKPIFLSVGYSSCYWCHVMERECFQNAAIARLLNEKFVSVKVDREERPDVDQIYMAALQAFGRGGWPMSLFLTPDGRPFFGGTYFPPDDRNGGEGFPTLLGRVVEAWRDHRPEIEKDADRLSALVKRTIESKKSALGKTPLSRALAAAGRAALGEQFDPEFGGFGFNPENSRRPKFPEPVNLVFLLDQHRRDAQQGVPKTPQPGPLEMVVTTLDRMARGGIRDQLAGGYHRYSTNRFWSVPHFEKMLYDNAQLASAHLLAFEATGDPRWRREAEATFAYVSRTMTAAEGAFYSALDAETAGDEGQYYVWTRDEVKRILGEGPSQDAFAQAYGLLEEPNFEKGRHVLLEPRTRGEQAASLRTTRDALEAQLAPMREKLLAARDRRPAPLRDDKVLTSWNGLMIAAYADGFRVLKDERYRAAAERAADFLLTTLRDKDGRLLRTYRAGTAKLPAYLEDYAFLAHGLLRLHAATGDPRRLEQARALTDRMISDFADSTDGGFFYTADDHESLLARPKDPFDNVLPGANSVAIRNLIALGAATNEPGYLDIAGKALEAFSAQLARSPAGSPLMLVALGEFLDARPDAAGAPVAAVDELPGSSKIVTVEVSKPKVVEGRSEIDVTLTITIREGFHINANPTGVPDVTPTRLTLADGSGRVLNVDYPRGIAKQLGSRGSEKVSLYEGTVTIVAHLAPDPKTPDAAPRDSFRFTLHYQACNDKACLAPAKLEIVVPAAKGG